MSNNSASSIRGAIHTALSALSTVQAVAHGHTQQYTGYPTVKIWLQSVQTELVDTAKLQKRVYVYALEVVQDSSQKARAQAETDFQDCIDQILDKFQSEWTLTDNCDIGLSGETTTILRDSGQGIQVSAIIPLEVTTYLDA